MIASAFDQIQSSLEVVEKSQKDSIYLEFDPPTNKWNEQMSDGQKVAIRFEGVMATTGSCYCQRSAISADGRTLKKAAKDAPGKPIKCGHGGPPIGKIEDAWYENGKLMVRGAVFEPSDDKGRNSGFHQER